MLNDIDSTGCVHLALSGCWSPIAPGLKSLGSDPDNLCVKSACC